MPRKRRSKTEVVDTIVEEKVLEVGSRVLVSGEGKKSISSTERCDEFNSVPGIVKTIISDEYGVAVLIEPTQETLWFKKEFTTVL